MLFWVAAIYFRLPVDPVFFLNPGIQLAFTSLYLKDDLAKSIK
jgi:hypothetical protein